MQNEMNLGKEIHDCAIRCGFDNCGIITIDEMDEFEELYQNRINNVPQSKYFYDGVGNLQGTKTRFPWAKSIVILTYYYGKYSYPKELQGKYAKAFFLEADGNRSQSFDLKHFESWLSDHKIRAEGGERFGAVSVAPLRYIAAKAGLGIIRKNNFFYTEEGTYIDLIGYVMNKECELVQNVNLIPCSEKCDLCQKACKTKSLQSPYTMNPFKCVSFCTTFGNSGVLEGLSPEMFEEWVCGCDNCQDVCPHNRRHDWNDGEDFSNLKEIAASILPENFKNLSDEFLIEQVIPKTAGHLQVSDVNALRKNAARAVAYQTMKIKLNS